MKRIRYWNIKKHMKFSFLIAMISFISEIITSYGLGWTKLISLMGINGFKNYSSAQVAIIGGADGPTEVFTSGSSITTNILANILLFAILMLFYKPMKRVMVKKQ